MPEKSRRNSRAFTLVELLVVIAIVAILIVLVAGGYGKIQQRVIAASDISSLRQIGMGMHQYIGDHNGIIPPVLSVNNGSSQYAQEYIAQELGITASLRATDISPKEWGPFIGGIFISVKLLKLCRTG